MSMSHIKQELLALEPLYKRPVSSQLIAYVRLYPFLYDKRHPAYKDGTLKQARWALIASQMGVTVEQVKIRWKSLRDRYIRDRKAYELRKLKAQKESDDREVARPTWSLYNILADLLEGTSDETNSGAVTEYDQSLESYPLPTPQSSFDEDSENSTFSDSEQPGTSADSVRENPKKRKLDSIENRLCTVLQTTFDKLGETSPRGNQQLESNDEAYLYAMSLVPRFRTFSKRKMLQARFQIEKILFELDDED